jgi:hypothetical protein
MRSESDFSQATYLTWWIMTGNGASVSLFSPSYLPWPGRVILPRRATTTSESESLFQKRRSLAKSDAHGQVRRQLIPVLWGKMEGMCKLLPRTMQNFAFMDSKEFSAMVLVCTKCFR